MVFRFDSHWEPEIENFLPPTPYVQGQQKKQPESVDASAGSMSLHPNISAGEDSGKEGDASLEGADTPEEPITLHRRRFAETLIGLGGATALGLILYPQLKKSSEDIIEKTKLLEAAANELAEAEALWQEINNKDLTIQQRKVCFVHLRNRLLNAQSHNAHAEETHLLYADRKVMNFSTITDEELLAGTSIPIADFRRVRSMYGLPTPQSGDSQIASTTPISLEGETVIDAN